MRKVLGIVTLAVAAGACNGGKEPGKRAARSDPPPARRAVDATSPNAARVDLPAAADLGPVRGQLSGAVFEPAKADLFVDPRGARLELHQKADRGPCEAQFSPDPDDLYLAVSFPAQQARSGGGGVTDEVRDTLLTWKKPTFDHVDASFALAIDALDPSTSRARGRLEVKGADGTAVAGVFDAALCVSPQRDLPAGQVHGLTWGDEAPDALPRQPLEAVHLGDRVTPAAVVLVDAALSDSMQHELHVFRDPPTDPCVPPFQVAGFNLSLGKAALSSGFQLAQPLTLMHPSGTPFGVMTWLEPGGTFGMEGNGDIALILDEVTATEVRGRVFAQFEDPAKGLLVGAFTARRCK